MDELEELRRQLSATDAELLALAARRNELSLQIGRVKQAMGRGTRDFRREKIVLDRARREAERHGLSPDLAEALTLQLIKASLSVQEQDRVSQASSGSGRRALVIGGSGAMGHWFVTFLDAQGYEITVADPVPPTAGVPHVTDWAASDLAVDLVVVCTPILPAAGILQRIADLGTGALVVDICSIKQPLAAAHEALRAAGVRATSIHPLFGPHTSLLSGCNLAIVPIGCPEADAEVEALFAQTMVRTHRASPDDHDRAVAWVLGLSHIVNLAFHQALSAKAPPLQELEPFSSATFLRQLRTALDVAHENPELHHELQHLNPFAAAVREELTTVLQRLDAFSRQTSAKGFVEAMAAASYDLTGSRP